MHIPRYKYINQAHICKYLDTNTLTRPIYANTWIQILEPGPYMQIPGYKYINMAHICKYLDTNTLTWPIYSNT